MITHINNYTFKSFKNYTGPIETPFKEKNILFGYNGKGKSSLSKGILDEYKKKDSVTENDYRFFDKDYIKNSLLIEESNEIKGIVANFGKENVDLEKEISKKKELLINITSLEEEQQKYENNIKNEIESIFNTKKGNSSIKKKSSSTLDELLQSYQKDLAPALKLVPKKEDLKYIKDTSEYEKELENIQNANIITFDLITDEEINELSRIMKTKYNETEIPTTKVLSWLKNGLEIHKDEHANRCQFCGNVIKLEEIEDKIEKYLNDKKQQDLLIIERISAKVNTIINQVQQLNENKILLENIVGENISLHYENIKKQIECLSNIFDIINSKLSKFESQINIDINIIKNSNKLIISNINDIKTAKEIKENEITNIINKSNTLIKGSIANEIIESQIIKKDYKEYKNKTAEIIEAKKQNDRIENEIIKLKNSKSTTSDFATFISELLDNLGIEFFLDIVDNNYVIKHRQDKTILTIEDISEGENNLLALLFFYYELFEDNKQKKFKNNIKLIIVDDPISSVDDVNKIYVLELIKRIISIENPQVFVFTHVWDDFCNLCYGKKDIDDEKNRTPYRFYELKKNNNGSYLKKTKYNETPYMHDFKEIYEFSKKSTTDDLDECEIYHYPNVMRKVLEEYMKFKVSNSSPTLDNVNNVKIALCESVNKCSKQDEIQIPTLLDVCNILSHKSARNPEQILKSAQYLMRKIRETDVNHFSTMTK